MLVRDRLGDFEQQSQALESEWTPEELHQLRILGKKLRYTMEMFVDVLPALKGGLTQLITLQGILGWAMAPVGR